MKQEPKAGRQIVSKSRYAVNLGGKFVLSGFGIFVLIIGAFAAVCTCILLVVMLSHRDMKNFWEDLLLFAVTLLLMGGGSAILLYFGVDAIKEAKKTDAGVPLTRANTADLPAPDSLVRASQEPTQAQQTVLLRATTQDTAPSAEQLLRASGKQGQE